jgi:type I restriction enzyme M protein
MNHPTFFKDNDVLLAKITPCFENGKAGLAKDLVNGIGFGSTEYYVIRAGERILPEMIYYYITSPRFRKLGEAQMTGSAGQQRIPKSFVKTFQIPLPPLAVQAEIVAEIEGYQKIIDGARQVVENYRPRIPINPDWPQVALGELAQLTYGYTDTAQETGDARFIRITDIDERGELRNDGAKYIQLTDEAKSYILTKGDLLVARTGATYGKTLLFDENILAVYASYLIKIDLDSTKLLPKYYWLFTLSQEYDAQKSRLVTGGGQPQFNANAIRQIQIPLPSLEVQEAIIAEAEQELAWIQANRQLITRFEAKIKSRIGRVWGDTPNET